MNKMFTIKRFMLLMLLSVLLFAVYLNYLNNLVGAKFSQPLTTPVYSTLPLDKHPKALLNMLLITEDQLFFKHSGVDFKEILRVLRDYLFYNKPIRGASTISQQLIKNILLTRDKTISRKLKEMLMALLLEASFDKNFILNYYINSVYLGQKGNTAISGFNHAARFYFDDKLADLSLEQMAILVALIKGPSYYHPIKHPQRLAKRKQLVLRLYHKYKKIVK
jgi:penicillin-binding protein 1B